MTTLALSCTEVLSQWSEKAACVWEMHVAGVDLRVLPGAYSMHVGIKKPNVHNGKVSRPNTQDRVLAVRNLTLFQFDWSKREFENVGGPVKASLPADVKP